MPDPINKDFFTYTLSGTFLQNFNRNLNRTVRKNNLVLLLKLACCQSVSIIFELKYSELLQPLKREDISSKVRFFP